MNASGDTWRRRKRVLIGGSFLFCILYALSDEFHQVFVPGRDPKLSDVLVDSAGTGLGIGLYVMVGIVKMRYSR